MNVYTTDKIRNVVLLGHGGCGKTTLLESMAFLSGSISRMGSTADGNTLSDYDKEEVKRKFSIQTSVIPLEWDNIKINFLDTPGYFDFIGEVQEAMSVANAAVIVISGKNGIETGTQKAWEFCEKYKLPRIFFVTDMDIDNASFRQVVEDLQQLYGKKIAPFHLPIREDEKFVGYINVIAEKGFRWNESGQVTEAPIPNYSLNNLEICRNALMEAVAETSEEFMDRYFNGDTFSENEIRQALRVNVLDGSIIPVSMGSSTLVQGIYTLLDDIVKYLPSPDKRECSGINVKTNQIFHADYDFAKPKTAYVFKTLMDPFNGKLSFLKVNSGVLKTDDVLYNHHKEKEEKIGKLYLVNGNKLQEIQELHAGDIGTLVKSEHLQTTDSLSTKANPIAFLRANISEPYTYMSYTAKEKSDEDKISLALQKLMTEDLTVKAVNDSENSQSLLYGIGNLHLDVIASKLFNRYKVEIILKKPKIAFKETILDSADVESKYKKQSGGHGQYGHVKMKFEPSGNLKEAYIFEQNVVGGAVPKNYFPAVEKGILEATKEGPLAAYPVVGVKATLYDGSYHPVDSSEMAFKLAAIQAFKKGFMQAKPILLEPIASLKVIIPEQFTGDIISDLNKRRARVLGMNPIEHMKQEIVADIPYFELYDYSTNLRSITGGWGEFSYSFERYERVPQEIEEAEIKQRTTSLESLE